MTQNTDKEWKPISTAPRDGTWFEASYVELCNYSNIYFTYKHAIRLKKSFFGFGPAVIDHRYTNKFTHWRKLPELQP